MLMTIKGLIFDFDGLILDTETPDFSAWQQIFTSYKAELPLEKWEACIGTTNEVFDVISFLEDQIEKKVDRDQLKSLHRSMLLEILETQKALPGVEDYLKRAKELRLKVAVASSAPFIWLQKHLTRLELFHEFDAIVSSNDVKKVKPYPDLYLEALKKLNIKNNEAIAFEDSMNGMKAAQDAGIYCVVVPNSVTRQMQWDNANLIINSMAAVKLDKIIGMASEQLIYSE